MLIKLYKEFVNESKTNDNFWKWFGNSVVVDNNGKPLIMYHGSPSTDIKVFKSVKGYFFFTSDKSEALRYTGEYKDYSKSNALISEYYIKAENPFNPEKMNQKEKDSIYKVIDKNLNSILNTIPKEFIMLHRENYEKELSDIEVCETFLTHNADNYLILEHPSIQRWIKDSGYDSFITIESGNGLNIAVYSNNQIKSVNNSGDFSINSDNIFE